MKPHIFAHQTSNLSNVRKIQTTEVLTVVTVTLSSNIDICIRQIFNPRMN